MVAVPAVIPLTTPDAFMVAMAVAALVHMPPGVASASEVVAAGHTVAVPVIVPATGRGLTVAIIVAAAVPHVLVTV